MLGKNAEKETRVDVNPEVLQWSIHESQKPELEIHRKFPQLSKWLKGSLKPTIRQLEGLASFLHVPFGYMFLDKPPETDFIETEFRAFKNKLPAMSKNLRDTITAMVRKQDWMHDHRNKLGWDNFLLPQQYRLLKTGLLEKDAVVAKDLLDLPIDWYKSVRDYREAYNLLKTKIEEKDIMVMSNAVVGSNNHRKLDLAEFRAFMLYDSLAPLIFINSNDSWPGRIFSLVHEYFHVLLEQNELFTTEDLGSKNKTEKEINQLTAEFLIHEEYLQAVWQNEEDHLMQIKKISWSLKVSQTALAIKLYSLGKISKDSLNSVISAGKNHYDRQKDSQVEAGRNFYNTFKAKISPSFLESVIRSTEAGETGYTDAFRLLDGIRGNTYTVLKDEVIPYG